MYLENVSDNSPEVLKSQQTPGTTMVILAVSPSIFSQTRHVKGRSDCGIVKDSICQFKSGLGAETRNRNAVIPPHTVATSYYLHVHVPRNGVARLSVQPFFQRDNTTLTLHF